MRAASAAAATASRPRSRRASASAWPRRTSARIWSSIESLEQRLVAVGGGLPLAGGELHVDLEPRPGRRLLVQEVAGRQAQSLGEVAQGHHRGAGDAGLERADVGLGVPLPRQLLLGQAGASPRLADPLADLLRQGGVMLGRSGGGLHARHGVQSTRHGKRYLTHWCTGSTALTAGVPVPMGHCRADLPPRTWDADVISADRAVPGRFNNAQPQHWRRLARLGPDTRTTRGSNAPRCLPSRPATAARFACHPDHSEGSSCASSVAGANRSPTFLRRAPRV